MESQSYTPCLNLLKKKNYEAIEEQPNEPEKLEEVEKLVITDHQAQDADKKEKTRQLTKLRKGGNEIGQIEHS